MFPDAVRDKIGYALYVALRGGKHRDTKALSGFGGAGVLEVISDDRGDTFRTVYTVRFEEAVYVLHAYQKNRSAAVRSRASILNGSNNGCVKPNGYPETKPEENDAQKEIWP